MTGAPRGRAAQRVDVGAVPVHGAATSVAPAMSRRGQYQPLEFQNATVALGEP